MKTGVSVMGVTMIAGMCFCAVQVGHAALISHYAFDEGGGVTATNSAAGAPNGKLEHGASYAACKVGGYALNRKKRS